MNSPIALFVYNRPLHTRKTVEALQANFLSNKSELFIFSDAAKDEASIENVKLVREYLKTISGFKSISIIESAENLGLANSIIMGVTDIVNKFGKIIVLEDDLVTSPYFLKYINDGLNIYENEDRVMSIHGYTYPIKEKMPDTFFLKNPSCWGWATWKNSWDLFEPDGKKLLAELESRHLISEFDFDGSYNFSGMLRRQIAGKNNSWAIRWYASALTRDKLTLYPGKSLVENIGFDGSGVHSNKTTVYKSDLSMSPVSISKLDVKESIIARRAFTKYFKSMRSETGLKGLAKKIVKKLIPLRTRVSLRSNLIKFNTEIRKIIGMIKGINIVIPNAKLPNYYVYKGEFNKNSTIIDVGCGFDADFSMYMIKKFNLKSIGIDPTLKHQSGLTSVSAKSEGHFIHKNWAISASDGKISFNESVSNVSGSILNDHKNLKDEKINMYEVDSVSLAKLPERLGLAKIEFIKLDIEGAEYELIESLNKDDLNKYEQIFVEFHHHAIAKYSKKDTVLRAEKMRSFGFKSFTLNNHDFLFYR